MDQEQVLNDLDGLVRDNGGIAVLGDKSFWTGDEEWQHAVKKVIQKYLGEERRAGKGRFKDSKEPWEAIIARSAFHFFRKENVVVEREWNTKGIIGYLFSTSFAAPRLFGNKLNDFRRDVKKHSTI